jgi:hypothetical protein
MMTCLTSPSQARRRAPRASLLFALPLLFFFFAEGSLPTASEATRARTAEGKRTVTCTFSHSSYSGLCRQTEVLEKDTTGKQACESILACLNDQRCIKTYCDATTIRGGWRLESVEAQPEEK